jgi:hypothetical protein
MKQKLLIVCLAICICGCKSVPTHEIDYTGQLPENVPATFTTVKEFATDLAAETTGTTLKIAYENPMEWAKGKTESKGMVELGTQYKPTISGKGNVSVHIGTYEAPEHEINILICGDIDMPEAKVIAAKAEEIFARKYPGYKLVRFIRYQGLAP